MKKYEISKEELQQAVDLSTSKAEVFRRLKMSISGGAYKILNKRLAEYEIETSHFVLPKPPSPKNKKDIHVYLVVNSTYNSTSDLKKRLIKEGLLENQCVFKDCPTRIYELWREKPIVFHLDHINGINNDNRLENLRILCPICHTQTETWCRGSARIEASKERAAIEYKCESCDKNRKYKYSKICAACRNKDKGKPKIDWPSKEVLLQMLEESNYVQAGKKLGVSDTAIRKHLRKLS